MTKPSNRSRVGSGCRGRELGDAQRLRDAGAPEAGIAIDEDAELAPGRLRGRRETGQQGRVVEADPNRRAAEERCEPFELSRADEVVRDEDVVEAGVDHRLGLAQLLAGQSHRTELELPAGDLDRPVRLDVRSVREPQPVAFGLPAAKVPLEAIDVDHGGRGVDRRLAQGVSLSPVSASNRCASSGSGRSETRSPRLGHVAARPTRATSLDRLTAHLRGAEEVRVGARAPRRPRRGPSTPSAASSSDSGRRPSTTGRPVPASSGSRKRHAAERDRAVRRRSAPGTGSSPASR